MGKFFGFIVVLLGALGVYFVVSDKITETRGKKNPWITKVRDLMAMHETPKVSSTSDTPWYAQEGSFLTILVTLHKARKDSYSVEATIQSALSGKQTGQSRMIQEALLKNFKTADDLGVFKDPANLIRMERGERPYAKAGGWEEEPMVAGHLVSPLLAPEAASSLVNLVIMPLGAQDLQQHELRNFNTEMIKKWREEKIITPESAKDLYEVVQAQLGK